MFRRKLGEVQGQNVRLQRYSREERGGKVGRKEEE